jgi:hypothetical protein
MDIYLEITFSSAKTEHLPESRQNNPPRRIHCELSTASEFIDYTRDLRVLICYVMGMYSQVPC